MQNLYWEVRQGKEKMENMYKSDTKSYNLFAYGIVIVLSILVFTFPIAHTATIKAICLILLLTLWFSKMTIQREWHIQKTSIDWFIFFYFLFGVLSLFSSVDRMATLNSIKKEMIVNFILLYLIVNNLKKISYIKPILIAIFLGNLIVIPYGFYDFFLIQKGNLYNPAIRFHSLSADFAFFSAYSVTTFPFIFIAFFYVKGFKHKSLLALLLTTNILALYLNHQRGAWIAVLIGCLFTLMIFKKWKVMIIFSLAFLAVLLSLLPPNVFQHGEKLISKSGKVDIEKVGGSITPRIETWKFALQKIKENPFLGYGLGRDNFAKKYPQLKEKFGPTIFHAHNIFLDTALQMGLGGLIVFVLLIGKILKVHWHAFKQSKIALQQYLLLSIIVVTIVFLIRNFFDTLFVSDSGSFLWFLWGIGISQCVRETETNG
ncbi:MAG: O-antigen ligase family protein [Thermodesulfovibrionales bacterium]|nr:O-antigen ligase family protein [Thermodesulfovibrionales bacterium]